MFRSRLVSVSQPLIQRNVVTQAKYSINNENKTDDYHSSSNSLEPPCRPLTQQFTHQVTNQVPPLEYIDLYKSDLTLREFLTKENKGQIKDMGAELGTFHWFEQGQVANRYPPSLQQFDRYGQRIDEAHFHPSYHELMQAGMRYGVNQNSLSSIDFNLSSSIRFIQSLGNHYQHRKPVSILMDIYNMP